jgi:subtilisin family serine protease
MFVFLMIVFAMSAVGLSAPVAGLAPSDLGDSPAADAGSGGDIEAGNASIDPDLYNETGTTQALLWLEPVDPEPRANETPVEARKRAATNHQRPTLAAINGTPHVEAVTTFWITNVVVVEYDAAALAVERLAALPNVGAVEKNGRVSLDTTAIEPASFINTTGESSPSLPNRSPATASDRPVGATLRSDSSTTRLAASSPPPDVDGYSYGLEQLRVPTARETFGLDGSGTSVAVLDSGIETDHDDLELAEDGWAKFDTDGNIDEDVEPQDFDQWGSHGTAVSGIVAGDGTTNILNNKYGVAPETDLYHGAVIPDCDEDGCSGTQAQIIGGIEWATENDVDVIVMSLGKNVFWRTNRDFVDPIRTAQESGTVVVASIGNEGEGTSSTPGNEYDSISVGAVNDTHGVPEFSSGETLSKDTWDSLPGWDAPDDWPTEWTTPSVTAAGKSVRTTVWTSDNPNTYRARSGTSFAAPHVGGAVALLAQYDTENELDPNEVEQLLEDTAWKPESAPEYHDIRYGDGIVNLKRAIMEEWIGVDLRGVEFGSKTYEHGESVDATVEVRNTGEKAHTFFVGHSVQGRDKEWRDNDNTTGRSVTLEPGETREITVPWRVEDDAPTGSYESKVGVWLESDRDRLDTRLEVIDKMSAFDVVDPSYGVEIVNVEGRVGVGDDIFVQFEPRKFASTVESERMTATLYADGQAVDEQTVTADSPRDVVPWQFAYKAATDDTPSVDMRVELDDGVASDTETVQVVAPPSASFRVGDGTNVYADEPVVFNASPAVATGENTSYRWEINGTEERADERVEHVFEEAGQYEVTLTVEDDLGQTTAVTKQVAVKHPITVGNTVFGDTVIDRKTQLDPDAETVETVRVPTADELTIAVPVTNRGDDAREATVGIFGHALTRRADNRTWSKTVTVPTGSQQTVELTLDTPGLATIYDVAITVRDGDEEVVAFLDEEWVEVGDGGPLLPPKEERLPEVPDVSVFVPTSALDVDSSTRVAGEPARYTLSWNATRDSVSADTLYLIANTTGWGFDPPANASITVRQEGEIVSIDHPGGGTTQWDESYLRIPFEEPRTITEGDEFTVTVPWVENPDDAGAYLMWVEVTRGDDVRFEVAGSASGRGASVAVTGREGATPASLDVGNVSVPSEPVSEPPPGETATLSVHVDLRNTGDLEATEDIEFVVNGEVRETVSSSVPGNINDTLSVAVPIERGDAPEIELRVRGGNDTVTKAVDVGTTTVTAVTPTTTTGTPTATPTIGPENETGTSLDGRTQNATGTSAPPLPGFSSLAAAVAIFLVATLARYRR